MTAVNRFVSALALGGVLAAAAIPAQAGSLQGAVDVVPTLDESVKAPLVSRDVIGTKSSAKGMSIIYSDHARAVAPIGPRDVSNAALNAASYSNQAPVGGAQLAEK